MKNQSINKSSLMSYCDAFGPSIPAARGQGKKKKGDLMTAGVAGLEKDRTRFRELRDTKA
jgi:hypothetical protein